MNLDAFESQLKAEGYQVITSVQQPVGYAMGEHVHDFDACALILEGDFTITVDGADRHYGPGQIFRLPAGTPHSERAGLQGVRYRAGRRTREA
jgi:quercetin dioxygenase-like cupin family protein